MRRVILYLDPNETARTGLTPVASPDLLNQVQPLFWERVNRELKHAGALPESAFIDQC